jgi:hypothetical protein
MESSKNLRFIELMLILIAACTAVLFGVMEAHRLTSLNLFYLPVVLSGFFLGRYHAGVLALLSVICVSIVAALDLSEFGDTSPLVVGLVICVWGATLGLTAILVGTLSDELSAKISELRDAYVGVVEVLSQYLQGSRTKQVARPQRIADLGQRIGAEMRLPSKAIEDIRVAALLCEFDNVEVTSRVVSKAVDAFGETSHQYTFRGSELLDSLAPVIKGSLPLVMKEQELRSDEAPTPDVNDHFESCASIIRAARAYVAMREADPEAPLNTILEELKSDVSNTVVEALEQAERN